MAEDGAGRGLAEFERRGEIYPHADAVDTPTSGTLTVFNICGNKYRLIVRIKYAWRLINIRCVLSHKEYDRNKWKE